MFLQWGHHVKEELDLQMKKAEIISRRIRIGHVPVATIHQKSVGQKMLGI